MLLQGESFTAGSVDLMKCFDQLLRPLLFALLWRCNFPRPLRTAYQAFLDNLVIHNVVCGHIGEPHRHPCGIPQRCPLSMLMVAFMFKPWVNMLSAKQAVPRVLADDIMVAAHGPEHLSSFVYAFDLTLAYIQDIGAAIAPQKSYLLSTNRVARKRLRTLEWQSIGGARIPVYLHARDLGTHISSTEGKAGTTLVRRASKALGTLSRLRMSNYAYEKKARICRTLVFPQFFYGVEACDLPIYCVDKLRAASARITSKGSRFQCNAIMFEIASYGADLDPFVHILIGNRTKALSCQVSIREGYCAAIAPGVPRYGFCRYRRRRTLASW